MMHRAEIDDSAEVFPGDVLYCTGGEPFETARTICNL
jgi:hypothetical protein